MICGRREIAASTTAELQRQRADSGSAGKSRSVRLLWLRVLRASTRIRLKALRIAPGKTNRRAIAPTDGNHPLRKVSPLSRPLFLYVNKKRSEAAGGHRVPEFLSGTGTELVKEVHYIPLPSSDTRCHAQVAASAIWDRGLTLHTAHVKPGMRRFNAPDSPPGDRPPTLRDRLQAPFLADARPRAGDSAFAARLRVGVDAHDGRHHLRAGDRDAHRHPAQQGLLSARFAVDFFTGTQWTPQFEDKHFGILPLLSGTFLVAGIAAVIGLPIGLAGSIYLSEYASPRTRTIVKPILEILAGIPTVVYGYFALVFVTPYVLRPIFQGLFGFDVKVFNAASAGIVVAIMIIPIVTSLSEDALRSVPQALREAAYALGSTKYHVSTSVVVPAALSGILASFLLAISRAVGETMAVAIAAGQTPVAHAQSVSQRRDDDGLHRECELRRQAAPEPRFQGPVRRRDDALCDDAGDEHPVALGHAAVPGDLSMSAAASESERAERIDEGPLHVRRRSARSRWTEMVRVHVCHFDVVRTGRADRFAGRRALAGSGLALLVVSDQLRLATPRRGRRPCGLWGSLWLVSLATLFAVPVGVGAGIFLEEYEKKGWLRTLIEINLSNLAGVPSIVYGILGMAVFVKMFGAFQHDPKVLEVSLVLHDDRHSSPVRTHRALGGSDAGLVDLADRDRRFARGIAGDSLDRSDMRRMRWARRTGRRFDTRSCRPLFPASSPG